MTMSLSGRAPLMLAALVASLLWSAAAAAPEARGPSAADFRSRLLKVMKSYPTDGSHGYHWPKSGGWKGTTCDLEYAGERVAKGDPKGRCYCCGLTFEVFFKAYKSWAEAKKRPFLVGDIKDARQMRRFIGEWFGSNGDRRCLQSAIVKHKLGKAISRLKDARKGDFVQFWRGSGSGHSAVFLGWERDAAGEIVKIRYWSTQGSTRGIGSRSERLGGKGVKRDEIYLARVGPTR